MSAPADRITPKIAATFAVHYDTLQKGLLSEEEFMAAPSHLKSAEIGTDIGQTHFLHSSHGFPCGPLRVACREVKCSELASANVRAKRNKGLTQFQAGLRHRPDGFPIANPPAPIQIREGTLSHLRTNLLVTGKMRILCPRGSL